MNWFKSCSLRTKLLGMTVGVSAGALLLASVIILVYQIRATHSSEVTRLQILARVLATNCSAPILFSDSKAAHEVLASLASEPNISQAFIQTTDGHTFVRYKSNSNLTDSNAAKIIANLGHVVTGNTLYLREGIKLNGTSLGTLYIESSLLNIQRTVWSFFEALLLAIIFSLALAAILGSKLQTIVAGPIRKLTSSMHSISSNGDYAVRVPVDSSDELGTLVVGFNDMLSEIQLRDQQLKDHTDLLEERVSERTREISLVLEEAEEASRLKSQFLANMSHEIRTPMNGMLGMTDLLIDMRPTPDQSEYLQIIKQSGKHLLTVVNDILDFSKIEAGQLEISEEPFNVREFVTKLQKAFESQICQKRLSLEVEIAADVPKELTGDPHRIRQIIVNLLGNAIKFTSRGKIVLLVSTESASEKEINIRFSVIDSGVGIPKDKQEQIFEAFSQADGSVTRKFGGTGLGLSISLQLALMMNGKISLESPVPSELASACNIPADSSHFGSAFYFTAPFPTQLSPTHIHPAQHPQNAPERLPQSPKRILVAEDNLVNQKLVKEMLRRSGHDVTIVNNGQKAVDALDDYLNTGLSCPFDIVLMDLQMPVLDGLSATREIRNREQHVGAGSPGQASGSRLPIVALTAHAFDQHKTECLNNGMDAFATKPINRQDLLRIIDELTKA